MNAGLRETFLIDSNSLIQPYNSFYSLGFVPQFWDFLEREIKAKRIVILDMVYAEIGKVSDDLSAWLKNITPIELLDHKNAEILSRYREILNYIQTCGDYRTEALNSWAREDSADPWLIAAAMTQRHTVITFEAPNTGLNKINPSKIAKIPDVCRKFNVSCDNLYYMMKTLKFRAS
jgi:rRNA-processing protein FCF1